MEKCAHFTVLVGRSFQRNKCPARASALSYTTLLALIPMLAVALSFTSSLLKGESEERIDQFIDQMVNNLVPPAHQVTVPSGVDTPVVVTVEDFREVVAPPGRQGVAPAAPAVLEAASGLSTNAVVMDATGTNSPSAAEAAIASLAQKPEIKDLRKDAARNIREFIQNTRSGTLGVTGSIALVFIAISMLARIEDTFNDIWGVVRGRTWFMRIVLYWAVITFAPLLLISALALASGPHLDTTRQMLGQTPVIGNLLFLLLPVGVLWLAFGAFYKLVPNTKVDWTAALAGGLTCAVLWYVNNSFSAFYVSRVVTNSKIYGGLGMVPVFMIGLYFSWLFLLLGAQVAYAWQNRGAYLQEKLAERVDQRGREFVALRLMTCVGQYFQSGEAAASVSELSATLGVPSRLTQQIMHTLKTAQLISEVTGPEPGYLPARPLETITCYDILMAMRTTNGQPLPKRDEPATNEVLGEFERIQAAERQAAATVTMAALVSRAQARLQLAAPVVENPPAPGPASGLLADTGAFAGATTVSMAAPAPASPLPEPVVTASGAPAAPAGSDVVSIKLPNSSQSTNDEESAFPL